MGAAIPVAVYVDELEQRRREAINRLRLIKTRLRDVSNPFLLEPEYFRKHYRLTPELALNLVNLLYNQVDRERVSAIPVHLQILSVLRFLAEGQFQKGVSSDWNNPVSQSTMSRMIERVVNAILAFAHQFIVFPQTREERQRVQNRFLRFNRIPGIIGLIDCVKVPFIKPAQNEEIFYNHNAGCCMNVQVIIDADFIIRNIRVCPGSNTDHFIWQFSEIKEELELLRANENVLQEEGSYYLLGDNGYVPSPIILTPIVNAPIGSPEAVYTAEHVRTRCRIEQCFGILTRVWLAISKQRKLYYSPQKVANIITACAILHNFRKLNGMVDDQQPIIEDNDYAPRNQNYEAGIAERHRLINLYY